MAVLLLLAGVGLVVWGADAFAENLAGAAARLGVSSFALALLLAGAEPEELVTAVTAAIRDVPAIALGDVVGANVAACLAALGAGAVVATLPFGAGVRRYALLGLPLGAVAVAVSWDGRVGRPEGAVLVALSVAYVAWIWRTEKQPPAIGELAELDDPDVASGSLLLAVAGVAALALGASLAVDAVRDLSDLEDVQADLGLVVVGLATAFELVVLAVAAARKGAPEAAVAAVVGSVAYNATMTLGAAALARPLDLADAALFHGPAVAMVAALAGVTALGWRPKRLDRPAGIGLLVAYAVFVVLAT